MTDLSIILVNYKNPALLRLFLRSLQRILPKGLTTEVIIVDSASTPETRNIVTEAQARYDDLVLIPSAHNTGYTRGVNIGLDRSKGAFVLNLNPDTILTPGSIESLITFLRENPTVGLVGPKLLNMDGTRQASCYRFYTPYTMVARRLTWLPRASRAIRRFLMDDVAFDGPRDVDWLMGSAFMARREAIQAVGRLDERFFHYCSDDDWARRFWQAGWRVVYYPLAEVYHWHARQSKGPLGILHLLLRPQGRWHIADAFRYFRKHGLSVARPGTV